MTGDLFDDIIQAVEDREEWATRQDGLYRMRFKGVGRSNAPYPNAPDMKYGLPDALIEKLKSLYIGTLYAGETLANFVCTAEQRNGDTTSAANWFDWQLKQESNFERTIFIGADKMLESGFTVLKIFYDPDRKQVRFDNIDPLHIIVPKQTEELADADFLVHVMRMSVAQYKRNPLFNQDRDFVKRIKGKGADTDSQTSANLQSKDFREGLTCGANDNEIIIWEVYRRSDDTAKATIVVDTIAPVIGWSDSTPVEDQVRPTFGLPFDHGRIPLVKVRMEITDKGWYSSRGVTEIVAPHETALSKTWNSKLQFQDYFANPTYSTNGEVQGSYNNFKPRPGAVLPPGLTPTPTPSAPADLEGEMQFVRALAEDRIAVPDLNASEHLSGNQSANGSGVTATQINAIVGQSGQSNDLRARVFRLDLAEVFWQAWQLYIQFRKDALKYVRDNEVQQLPQSAMHGNYVISPNGSPDSWNKQAQSQAAFALYQIISQSPYINKGEALKWLIEQVSDPALIKRLYEDPGDQAKKQGEQQAEEITIMLIGYPAEVDDADDDKTHLTTLSQFVERRLTQNEAITPEVARLFLMHGAAHAEALQKKKDPLAKQIMQQTMPIVQALQQIAGQPDQQMSPGAGSVPPGIPPGGPAPGAPPADPNADMKLSIDKGNMLSNMARAGVQLNPNDFNAVLQALALPPMVTGIVSNNAVNAADKLAKHATTLHDRLTKPVESPIPA